MPTLKQISCSLELGSSTRLKEYDHRYTDGGVEAFVAVPDTQIPFHVRVTSSGYIAPGLAVYVFMDGAYQCNRNRQRLAIPGPGSAPSETEVDFKLRQKEEKTSEGLFVAREWTFAQLKTGNADRAPDVNSSFASNVGTIEVVVLRCKEGGAREDAVDPAHTVVGVAHPESSQSRAGSVVNAAQALKPASVVQATSKVSAAKAPSVARAPSKDASKVASEAGGLFGLFEGADDGHYEAGFDGAQDYNKHGHPIRFPSYVVRRPPPPDYRWDNVRGAFRHVPSVDRSPDLPSRSYDDEYRSLDVQPKHSAPPEDIPPGGRGDRGDVVFIEESAKRFAELVKQGTEYAERYTVMTKEATLHRNEPGVFPTMIKALQRKAQEITSVNEEINDLYRSIDACMRRMDKNDFQQMRSFLHQERVYPELQIVLTSPPTTRTSRRVSLQAPRSRTASRVQITPVMRDWQNIGAGRTRQSLAARKQQGPDTSVESAERRQSPIQSRTGNEDMDGVGKWTQDKDLWETTSAKKSSHSSNDVGWGIKSARKDAIDGDDAWGNSPANNDDVWAATPTKRSAHKNCAWDETPIQQIQETGGGGDAWGNDNDRDNAEVKSDNDAGGWAAVDDDAPQNDSWGDNKHSAGNDKAADGCWGGQDAARSEKKSEVNGGWDATGGDDAKPEDAWGATDGDDANKSQVWGGGNDTTKTNQPLRKQSGAKPGPEAGWGKQASINNGAGGWDDGEKLSRRATMTHEKGVQAVPRSFGNDGAQSRSSRDDAATEVSAIRPVIKPYWQVWDKSPAKEKRPRAQPRDAYVYPAPPTVVAPFGKAPSVSHGVQAGRGANYMHKLHQPEYLDSMQKPYAIFTFKYRSKAAVEKILRKKIDTSNVQKAVQEVEEERLMRLSKDELVAELMRRQMMSAPPSKAASHASKLRDDWEKKAAGKTPSNSGWANTGGSKNAPAKVASAWAADIKPSDSVSNVATSRASKKKADSWQQIGTGQAAAAGGWDSDKASNAKTEEHWAAGDADMKQAGGDIW